MSSNNSNSQSTSLPSMVMFSSAGLGGIIGWTIVHPLNTLSVRRNLSIFQDSLEGKSPTVTLRQFASEIIRKEGISALYKGITAGWMRQVFYSTSVFGFFEVFRDLMASSQEELGYLSRFVAGIGSGAVAALVSCPAEVSLVRISNDNSLPLEQRRNYQGILNAFIRIRSEEGFKTFFRGVQPFVYRAILVGAIQIGTYDHFREVYRQQYHINNPWQNVFLAAMTAGFIYSFVTMPLETVKNRMAFQRPDPMTRRLPYTNIVQTFRSIIQNEGIPRLWSGYLPYYLRCGLHTLVMFSSIEGLRNCYRQYHSWGPSEDNK